METPQTVHVIHEKPAQTKTSGLAITSMIIGILSILGAAMFLLPSLLAVIFGHIGINQCNRDPMMTGKGMAITGLVLGYLTLAGWVVWFLFFGGLMLAGAAASASGY